MGYESNGFGEFSIRNINQDIENICEQLQKEDFEYSLIDSRRLTLSFNCWRVYNGSDAFKVISEHLNGEFVIDGEEFGDIWKLIFKAGEVFIQKGHVVFDESMIMVDLNKDNWCNF